MSQWDYTDQLLLNVAFWILIGVTLIGLVIRIYVRVHVRGSVLHRKSWHWSDIFLVFAWVGFFSAGIVNLIAFAHYGYVSSTWEEYAGTRKFIIVRKLNFVYNITFWPWLFFVKASLLCFFNELITRQSHFKTWLAIRITGVLVLLGGLAITFYGIFWCEPISRQWSAGEGYCWVDFNDRYRMIVFRQMYHVVTDVMIFAIPLPLLPLILTLTNRQRFGVAIMFLLGLFATVSAVIFMLGVLQWDNNSGLQTAAATQFLQYEPPAELAAAILIQCVPAMRAWPSVYKKRKKSVVEMARGRTAGMEGVMEGVMEDGDAEDEREDALKDEGHTLDLDQKVSSRKPPQAEPGGPDDILVDDDRQQPSDGQKKVDHREQEIV